MRATSLVRDGHAAGLLVEKLNHRTLRIEGNPQHPAGLQAANPFLQGLLQATVAQLYHPSRARRVRRHRCPCGPTSWAAVLGLLRADRQDRGAGLRLLLEPTNSPLLLHLLARVHTRLPAARVTFHSPRSLEHASEGARLAFGRALLPRYDCSAAQVIVALDSDLLAEAPFASCGLGAWSRRGHSIAADDPRRLHVVEGGASLTGSLADHRLVRPSAQVGAIAAALAAEHGLFGGRLGSRPRVGAAEREQRQWLDTVTADLAAVPPGNSLVVVGERQPAKVHAAGYAINQALGNFERTLSFTEPVLPPAGVQTQTLAELAREMHDGKVDALVIIDGNCIATAPAELGLREALPRVPDSFYFGAHENETAKACCCFAPTTHFLEAWGDARAYDGTVSFLQPLVHPLVDARPPAEILAVLAGDHDPQAELLLRDFWRERRSLSESAWCEAVERGFLADSAFATVPAPALDPDRVARALNQPAPRKTARLAPGSAAPVRQQACDSPPPTR